MERLIVASTHLEIAEKKRLQKQLLKASDSDAAKIKKQIEAIPARYILLDINTDAIANGSANREAVEEIMSRKFDIDAKVWRDDKPPKSICDKFFDSLKKRKMKVRKNDDEESTVLIWKIVIKDKHTAKAFRESFKEATGWEAPKTRTADPVKKEARSSVDALYARILNKTASAEDQKLWEALQALKAS